MKKVLWSLFFLCLIAFSVQAMDGGRPIKHGELRSDNAERVQRQMQRNMQRKAEAVRQQRLDEKNRTRMVEKNKVKKMRKRCESL